MYFCENKFFIIIIIIIITEYRNLIGIGFSICGRKQATSYILRCALQLRDECEDSKKGFQEESV